MTEVRNIDTVPSLFSLDNETAIPIPNENAPNWALQILERIQNLESRIQIESQQFSRENNSEDAEIVFFDGGSQDQVQRQSETTLDQSEDEYITERDPLRDLQTYPEILEALPSIKEDFFKSSLTDIQRRRFLASCPRNKDMDYDPPILNKVGLSYNSRRMDSQLVDIQYRLSGITRPIDFFTHNLIQNERKINFEETKDFVRIMQILLADISPISRKSELKTCTSLWGVKERHLKFQETATKKELIDTKQLLEHATATQAIKKTLGNVRGNYRRGFGYRKFGTEAQENNIQIQQDRSFQMPQQGQEHTRPKYESTGTTNNNNDSLETVNRQQLDTGNNNKRFQNTFQENTAYKNNKGKAMPHEGRNHGIDKKEGHRRIPRWKTEFLLPSVYYTKEKRGTKTSAKPEASQQLHRGEIIQNGNFENYMETNSTERLHGKHRSARRLYARVGQRMLQKVSAIPLENKDIPVQGSTFWAKSEPMGIHKDPKTSIKIGESKEDLIDSLSRRFAGLGRNKRKMSEKSPQGNEKTKQPRIYYKREQIISHSKKNPRTPGIYYQFKGNELKSSKTESSGYQERSHETDRRRQLYTEETSSNHWETTGVISGPITGKDYDSKTDRTKEYDLVYNKKLGNFSNDIFPSSRKFELVENPIHTLECKRIFTRNAGIGNIHRCEQQKLWDNSRGEEYFRKMESRGAKISYKSQGADSYIQGITDKGSSGQEHVDSLGQQHGHSLCQEVRWNKVGKATRSFGKDMETLYHDGYKTPNGLYSFNSQPSGRSIETPITIPAKKVIPDGQSESSTMNKNKNWTLSACRISVSNSARKNIILSKINAATIINFLNEGKLKGNWAAGTLYNYRTVILDMLDNSTEIKNNKLFVDNDLSPIIEKLKSMGKNEDMSIVNLTSKLCFFLGFCGFMRPSDIERIDESRTVVEESFIRLIIVSPKERRNGTPIKKACYVNSHPTDYLCPRKTYIAYKQRVAYDKCKRSHPENKKFKIYSLVRKVRNHSEHVGSEWISKSIKTIIKLLKIPEGKKVPKARALGSSKE
ncbi:hypothetical protein BB558_007361 [Smittium angustum]|uniref:Uncharacterized protein n=1 Tax=Smittium angustum TaxID=133377 RepID=A0A2U1IV85_SMIAN|nr:hypothetical protein BB558_007361 [Smittium angustum]